MRRVTQFTMVLVAVLLVAVIPSLLAQTSGTGSLTGRVVDPAGNVIPGAAVTLTSTATGLKKAVITGDDGLYNFPLLLPGQYSLAIEAKGFKKMVVPTVTIVVSEAQGLTNTLQVGGANEEVTVSGSEQETIQTESSTLGTLVDSQQVVELPLSTRNYTNLLAFSANASAPVNNASGLGKGFEIISVNGSGEMQNNFQMDGASVNNETTNQPMESGANGSFGIPSPDSIQEFNVQTSSYDAGYGRNSGANVNVVTKSGSNKFHGAAFEFFRNTALNANDFFLKYSQLEQGLANKQQALNQHQFGGVVGGRVIRDKLFFFLSYQETRQKNGATPYGYQTGAVLPNIPTGDRSMGTFQAALGQNYCHIPTFSTVLAGAIGIPGLTSGENVACDGTNINPVAIAILNLKLANGNYYIPSSTVSGPVSYSVPALYVEHQGMGNLDYILSPKETLATRFFYATDPTNAPFPGGLGFPGPDIPGNPVYWDYSNTNSMVKLTSTFTPHLLNEAFVAYERYGVNNTNEVPFTSTQVGMTPVQPDLNLLPNIWFLPILESVTFDMGSHPFFGNNAAIDQYQASDQVSWTHGRENIRFGGALEMDQWNWVFNSLAQGAVMIFPSFQDFLIGMPAGANGSPIDNIISESNFDTRGPAGGINKNYRANSLSFFGEDDIRLNSRLTVNAGLRWDYYGGLYEAHGRFSTFDLEAVSHAGNQETSPGSDTGGFVGYIVPSNYNGPALPAGVVRSNSKSVIGSQPKDNFEPRLGFALTPTASNKWVVRAGGGFFYDRTQLTGLAETAEQSIPYAFTLPYPANGFFATQSLADPFAHGQPGWNQPLWVDTGSDSGSNLNATVVDKITTPVVYAWNLNTQYEFMPHWTLELGYAGSHGLHQDTSNKYPFNAAPLASATNPINGQTTSTESNALLRVPYLGMAATSTGSNSLGAFKYNSVEATVKKQMSNGLQLQAAYAFTRSFSTGGGSNEDTVHFSGNDMKLHYGPNYFYRPHRFTINYLYNFPYADHAGLMGKAFGGWTFSGVGVVQSGNPMTVMDGNAGTVTYGTTSGNGVVEANAQYAPGKGRKNIGTSGSLYHKVMEGLGGGNGYINWAAFTNAPTSPTGGSGDTLWGNSGWGTILGPGQDNWDMALEKATKVGGLSEEARILFRAEFSTPSTTRSSMIQLLTGLPGISARFQAHQSIRA